MSNFPQTVSCQCGAVKFQAVANPIVTAVCYCEDCQKAGDIFDFIENIKPFRDADGGTAYVTLHDKNWVNVSGEDFLDGHKLNPGSPTTRYIARCCQSPLFLKFQKGFWTSTYRARYPDPPALEWRNKVSKRQSKLPFPDDIPRYKNFPLKLFRRLLTAWLR